MNTCRPFLSALSLVGVLPCLGCFTPLSERVDDFIIKTDPAHSELYLNGAYAGTTPYTLASCRTVGICFMLTEYRTPVPFLCTCRQPVTIEVRHRDCVPRILKGKGPVHTGVPTRLDPLPPWFGLPRCRADPSMKTPGRKAYEIIIPLKPDLVDFREACRILGVSPMTAFPMYVRGEFPKPHEPPRDDRSAYGARWFRADIEAWRRQTESITDGE